MANKMPSMLALLGLLAVAGYQNRDKIGEAIKRLQNDTPSDAPTGGGGILGALVGAAAGSGGITGGLADLMNSFRNAGQAEIPTPGSRRACPRGA